MEFKNRLKELREERNLSQKDLSNRIGFSQSQISNWEKGITTPTMPAIIALIDLFDISLNELTGRDNIFYQNSNSLKITDNLNKSEKELLEIYNQLSMPEQAQLIGFAQGLLTGNEINKRNA